MLFCRRCWSYDCRAHGACQPVHRERRDPIIHQTVGKNKGSPAGSGRGSPVACGADCYRHILQSAQQNSSSEGSEVGGGKGSGKSGKSGGGKGGGKGGSKGGGKTGCCGSSSSSSSSSSSGRDSLRLPAQGVKGEDWRSLAARCAMARRLLVVCGGDACKASQLIQFGGVKCQDLWEYWRTCGTDVDDEGAEGGGEGSALMSSLIDDGADDLDDGPSGSPRRTGKSARGKKRRTNGAARKGQSKSGGARPKIDRSRGHTMK